MASAEPLESVAPLGPQDTTAEFFKRAAAANWGLGALLRFTSGPILQLVALQIFDVDIRTFLVLTVSLGLAQLLQLAGLATFYRHGAFRPLLACYRARTWALLLLAASPFLLPVSAPLAVVTWAILIVAVNGLHAMGFMVCWPPIIRAATDQRARGRITSRLRAIQTCVASILAVSIAFLGPSRFGSAEFAVLALIFAAFSFVATRQIEWMSLNVRVESKHEGLFGQLARDLRFLRSDARSRRFLALVVVFGFVGLPLQIFYLDGLLDFPRQTVFWFLAVNTMVGILAMLAWGATIDRRGGLIAARNCLALIGMGVLAQVWCLAFPGIEAHSLQRIATVTGSMLVVNVGVQGLGLLWFNEALKILPAKSTSAGVMLFSCAYELSGSAASFTAGTIWSRAAGPDGAVMPYVWYLVAVSLAVATTLVALGRLEIFERQDARSDAI